MASDLAGRSSLRDRFRISSRQPQIQATYSRPQGNVRDDLLSSPSAPFLEATLDISSSSMTGLDLYRTGSSTGARLERDWRSVQVRALLDFVVRSYIRLFPCIVCEGRGRGSLVSLCFGGYILGWNRVMKGPPETGTQFYVKNYMYSCELIA